MSAGFTLIYSVKDTNQEVHVRLENKEKDIFSVSVIDDSSVLLKFRILETLILLNIVISGISSYGIVFSSISI